MGIWLILYLFECCVFSYAALGWNYTSLNEGIRIRKDVEGCSQVLIWGTILGGTEEIHQKRVMVAGLWAGIWALNFLNANQNVRQVDRQFRSWTKQGGQIPMNLDRTEVFHVPTIRNIPFFIICCGAAAQLGPRLPHFFTFLHNTHTHTHTHSR
jgi:hypothetical protein